MALKWTVTQFTGRWNISKMNEPCVCWKEFHMPCLTPNANKYLLFARQRVLVAQCDPKRIHTAAMLRARARGPMTNEPAASGWFDKLCCSSANNSETRKHHRMRGVLHSLIIISSNIALIYSAKVTCVNTGALILFVCFFCWFKRILHSSATHHLSLCRVSTPFPMQMLVHGLVVIVMQC